MLNFLVILTTSHHFNARYIQNKGRKVYIFDTPYVKKVKIWLKPEKCLFSDEASSVKKIEEGCRIDEERNKKNEGANKRFVAKKQSILHLVGATQATIIMTP